MSAAAAIPEPAVMREVFETIAYNKTTDAEAARRLVAEGNALLQRIL